MNNLIDKLKTARIDALKNHDALRKEKLTTLIGEAEMIGKNDGGRKTTDEETIKVILKFVKGLNEMIGLVKEEDKLAELEFEKALWQGYLNEYLPPAATDDMIAAIAVEARDQGMNFGQIMKHMREKLGASYDGKRAGVIVKDITTMMPGG